MKFTAYLQLLLILAFAGFSSCKKNEGGGTCPLTTAAIHTGSYHARTTLQYDALGRLAKTLTTGSANKNSTFSYRNDTTIIVEETSSSRVTNTVVKNAAGNIKDLIIRNSFGTISIVVHYDYNSNGQMIRQTTTYSSGAPLSYNVAYNAAGDAISETNAATGSASILHDYYTESSYQTGDAESISDFLNYGASATTNSHLCKTTTSISGTAGPTVTRNVYTFDDGGRIAELTQTIGTSTDTSSYNYTYTCD